MTLDELARQMNMSSNKCKLLDESIYKKRISAQPEGLKELEREWADETVKLHNLVNRYRCDSGIGFN